MFYGYLLGDPEENTVFEHSEDSEDWGWCYFCQEKTHMLAGPGHTPYNAEANWVCQHCLDSDAVVVKIEADWDDT